MRKSLILGTKEDVIKHKRGMYHLMVDLSNTETKPAVKPVAKPVAQIVTYNHPWVLNRD